MRERLAIILALIVAGTIMYWQHSMKPPCMYGHAKLCGWTPNGR